MPGAETFLSSADAYAQHVGRYGTRLATEFADFAGVQPELRALDVGCGTGALARVLAGRLGVDHVVGVEPSSALAEVCRVQVPGLEVIAAGAERLPFADESFDVVLAQLVVNFLDDPEAGARDMTRVTRPGGIVAACVWDYAGEMTLLRAFWDAAREVVPAAAAASDEGVVMPWCREGQLAGLWQTAGLRDVRSEALITHAGYVDFNDLWAPFLHGIAPSGAFCATLTTRDRCALRDAYRRRLGVADGPFELTARAWAVSGRVS